MHTLRKTRLLGLCLTVALASGCASTAGSALTLQERQAIEDIVVAGEAGRLNECQAAQIDLDRDGTPETVVVFKVGSHGSQVRVLKWHAGKPTTLFENGSDTPNTAFCLAEDVPTILLERKTEATQLTYQWNGKAFVQAAGASCQGRQNQITWQSCELTGKD
jgi:hypothetical protein